MADGPSQEALDAVARRALEEVKPGMRLGLGTGRAAEAFIRKLGEAARAGLDVRGSATSERSEALAREVGIATSPLAALSPLDIAFDGADEVAPDRSLIKGLGGALLRERVVAFEAKRFIVLVTPEKLVTKLCSRAPLPVEVAPFALETASRHIAALGARIVVRARPDGSRYLTDNGNPIVDAHFEPRTDARALDRQILAIPGVVDDGFFFDMAHLVLVGDPAGVREL